MKDATGAMKKKPTKVVAEPSIEARQLVAWEAVCSALEDAKKLWDEKDRKLHNQRADLAYAEKELKALQNKINQLKESVRNQAPRLRVLKLRKTIVQSGFELLNELAPTHKRSIDAGLGCDDENAANYHVCTRCFLYALYRSAQEDENAIQQLWDIPWRMEMGAR